MFFRQVIKSSTLNVVNMFATIIVAMALMPYIIHSIGDYQYGLWIFVASFTGYYGLLDFGLSTATSKFMAEAQGQNDVNEMNIVLNSSTAFFIIIGLLMFLISCIGAFVTPYFTTDNILTIQVIWLAIGTTAIFQFGLRGFYGVLFAKIRHDLMCYTIFAKLFVRTIAVIYFLEQGHGVITLAIITMVTELGIYCADMIIVKYVFPEMKISLTLVKWNRIVQMLQYGIFSMINQVSDLLRIRIIPAIVSVIFGVGYVVFFSIALRLVEIYHDLIHRTIGILTPVFSHYDGAKNKNGIENVFWISFRINLVISFLVGGGILFFSNPFISWWIGPEYVLASSLTNWLAIGFVAVTIQETGRSLVYGMNKHKTFSIISAVESAIGAALRFTLGYLLKDHSYGPIGIVIGFSISMIVFGVCIKPAIVTRSIGLSLWKYYMTIIEVSFKVGTPIVIYGTLMYNWITPSIVNIGLSSIGMCLVTLPFMWGSLNTDGKTMISSRIFSKIPVLRNMVIVNG